MLGKNVVAFGSDVALLYDETRPFPTETKDHIRLFTPIIEKLIQTVAAERINIPGGKLDVLDAGCGTGRVSIPFASAYSALSAVAAKNGHYWPELKIHGVDFSFDMLRHFQKNLHANKIDNANERFRLELLDIRDGLPDGIHYDLVIVQWLFHTMLDWRTAALRLDGVSGAGTLMMSLSEHSAFYRALDGDVTSATGVGRKFWTEFQLARKSVIEAWRPARIRRGTLAPIYLPPAMRLGTGVSDGRVEQMFRALGWEPLPITPSAAIDLKRNFRLGDLIKYVVRERAFTNMRIGAAEPDLEKIYGEVANKLEGVFSDSLNEPVEFRFAIRPQMYSKGPASVVPETIVDTIRDTIAIRRSHARFAAFNKQKLWTQLFNAVWVRLNEERPGQSRLGDQVKFIVAMPPYEPENRPYPVAHGPTLELAHNLAELWRPITEFVETDDVVHFSTQPGLALHGNDRLIPYVKQLNLSSREWEVLVRHGNLHMAEKLELVTDIADVGIRDSVLQKLRDAGIVGPLWIANAYPKTTNAMSRLAACANGLDVKNMYLFPAREYYGDNSRGTYGFLLGTSGDLDLATQNLIWFLVDLLIFDFHEFAERVAVARPQATEEGSPGPSSADDESAECPDKPKLERTWRGLAFKNYSDEKCDILLLSVRRRRAAKPHDDTRRVLPIHRESRGLAYSLGCQKVDSYRLDTPQVWNDKNRRSIIVHREIGQKFDDDTERAEITKLIAATEPKIVVLAGVAGGARPNDNRFGDVIVADNIFDLEDGEALPGGKVKLRESARHTNPYRELVEWVKLKADAWNNERFIGRPGVNRTYVGPWGSGKTYMANTQMFYERAADVEAYAYEMEAVSFAKFMNSQTLNKRPWLIIKGLGDFAEKHNWYQFLAAARAGEFLGYLYRAGMIEFITEKYSS